MASGSSPVASDSPTRPPSSTTEVKKRCSPTGPSWSRRSTSPASGSSRRPTSTWRSNSPPRDRNTAIARSRYGRSWAIERDRRQGGDHRPGHEVPLGWTVLVSSSGQPSRSRPAGPAPAGAGPTRVRWLGVDRVGNRGE